MIKNNVCYCDNDDRIVENTEWSIIHVIVDRPHMTYTALDFCDFKCMLQWTILQAVNMKIIPKESLSYTRRLLDR